MARRRISLPLLIGIATAFGISSSIQSYLLSSTVGDADSSLALHVAVLNLVYWYVPALLAPVILSTATRYQFARGDGWKPFAVHISGAFVYSVIHSGAMLGMRILLTPQQRPARGWWVAARIEYLTQLDWVVMTYLFLVGLAHALEYRREFERRALDGARLEARLLEAQLQSLQRQLQPHFLFNTLNAISGLMRTDVEAADRMMDRLGDLLRLTLESSNVQQVPLSDEVEVLRKYLEIEQVRFGNRLQAAIDVEPDALDAMVPNFLLQPLVENAVRHGIAPHARRGRLTVRACREGRRLVLRVADSGEGVALSQLILLNEGVGLGNTRARLEHLYGKDHACVFSNDGGFCVTISIPFTAAPRPNGAVEAGAA